MIWLYFTLCKYFIAKDTLEPKKGRTRFSIAIIFFRCVLLLVGRKVHFSFLVCVIAIFLDCRVFTEAISEIKHLNISFIWYLFLLHRNLLTQLYSIYQFDRYVYQNNPFSCTCFIPGHISHLSAAGPISLTHNKFVKN